MFDKVKAAVKGTKTLGLYDPADELLLEVDPSTKGIGTCFIQGGRLISCASKSLIKTKANYSNIERKCIMVVFVLSLSS